MIVEAPRGGKGRVASSERQTQRFFRAGLADAAGNRNDSPGAAVAGSRGERGESDECVGNAQQRRRRQMGDLAVHHSGNGAPLERGTDKLVAVMNGAAQRDKQLTGGETAGID